MRKSIFSALVLSGLIVNAQNDYHGRMGLNTVTPRATLEVKATSHNKAQGILFPTVTETVKNKWTKNTTKGLVAGTVIWNTTKKCLDVFDGTNWNCTDGTKPNTHGTNWTSIQVSQAFTNAPWMKLSDGVVNGSNSFQTYDGTGTLFNLSYSYYYTWEEAKTLFETYTNIGGTQYRLPTWQEWRTVIPDYDNNKVNYKTNNTYTNLSESNLLGSFTADYKNVSASKTTYAIRFKGNNDLLSAWKYEYISGKGMRITIVSLSAINGTSKTINEISNDTFWNNLPANEAKKTIFLPALGHSGGTSHGTLGAFWTVTELNTNTSRGYHSYFDNDYANSDVSNNKAVEIPIFLIRQ